MGEAQFYPPKYLSLPDFVIIVLKHKFLIGAIVLFAVTVGFIYLTATASKTTPTGTALPATYYSECAIAPDPECNLWGYITINRDLAQNIATAYGLSQLRYMSRDGKDRKWTVERLYIRNEKDGRIAPAAMEAAEKENETIPTLRFEFGREFLKLAFSCTDASLPQRILSRYLDAATEYYRRRDLEILNADIRAKHRLLRGFQEQIVIEKVSEQLASQIEKAAHIGSARFYPFEVVSPPTPPERSTEPNANSGKNHGRATMVLSLSLIGAAAFLASLVPAFLAEGIGHMKTLQPEKFAAMKKYMHLRVHRQDS
jgi:hypothetical protein